MLQAIGNAIDLPGSMVRDTLSLRNPLDQLMSPFSSDNRISGSQMLEGLGMDPGHSMLGTVLEMALDPTTYAGVGLAGRGAKAMGLGAKAASTYDKAKGAAAALRTPGGAKAAAQAAVDAVSGGAGNAVDAVKAMWQSPMNVDRALRGKMPILGSAAANNMGVPWTKESAKRLGSRTLDLVGQRGRQMRDMAIDTAYGQIPGARDMTLAAALGLPTANRMGMLGDYEGGDNMESDLPEAAPDPTPVYAGPQIPVGANFNLAGTNAGPDPMSMPDWARRYRYSLAGKLEPRS